MGSGKRPAVRYTDQKLEKGELEGIEGRDAEDQGEQRKGMQDARSQRHRKTSAGECSPEAIDPQKSLCKVLGFESSVSNRGFAIGHCLDFSIFVL